MPRHRFSDSRNRVFEVHECDGTTKFFQIVPSKTEGTAPLRARLDHQPLKPSVVTVLLQEIMRLQEPEDPTKRARMLRASQGRVAIQQELLDEIEWLGHKSGTKEFCCLWCDRLQSEGHKKDCRWLAARGGSNG